MLVHSVYFWLKPDAEPSLAGRFEAGLKRLTTIPDVRSAHYGRPEATPKRPVIDDSYSWALIAVFDDVAAHDRYQTHALHRDFVEEFRPIWERVQVYDVRVNIVDGLSG
jgi:hypothetical protein